MQTKILSNQTHSKPQQKKLNKKRAINVDAKPTLNLLKEVPRCKASYTICNTRKKIEFDHQHFKYSLNQTKFVKPKKNN